MILADRTIQLTFASGALITVIAFVGVSFEIGVGAFVGSVLSVLNMIAMRSISRRLVEGHISNQASAATLLSIKLLVMIGLCWFLIAKLGVNAVGFSFGVSALLVGLFFGSNMPQGTSAIVQEEN